MVDGIVTDDIVVLENPAVVDALSWMTWPAPQAVDLLESPGSAPPDPREFHPIEFARDGVWTKAWDLLYFEVIHVIPRSRDVGNVLSVTTFEIEVWNANYYPHYCAALAVTGPAGVSVEDGIPIPGWLAPFSSAFWTAVVDVKGPTQVQNTIVWTFPGFGGTDCRVTGTRVFLCSLEPNWERGIEERFGYATRVLRSWGGREQRALLRSKPTRGMKLSVFAGGVEAQELAVRLAATGGQVWSVPMWRDQAELASPVAPGSTVVYVAAAGRGFEAGGAAVLWRDSRTWEALTVESVEADHLHLSSPAFGSWPAGTRVMPAMPARLLQAAATQRPRPDLVEAELDFSGEPA